VGLEGRYVRRRAPRRTPRGRARLHDRPGFGLKEGITRCRRMSPVLRSRSSIPTQKSVSEGITRSMRDQLRPPLSLCFMQPAQQSPFVLAPSRCSPLQKPLRSSHAAGTQAPIASSRVAFTSVTIGRYVQAYVTLRASVSPGENRLLAAKPEASTGAAGSRQGRVGPRGQSGVASCWLPAPAATFKASSAVRGAAAMAASRCWPLPPTCDAAADRAANSADLGRGGGSGVAAGSGLSMAAAIAI
jgi:hypothetical protein